MVWAQDFCEYRQGTIVEWPILTKATLRAIEFSQIMQGEGHLEAGPHNLFIDG
jgi:hypothetical protein